MDEKAPDLHRDPEIASEMAVNAVLKYLHECDVAGEQQKRQWIARVFEKAVAKEFIH